MPTPPGSIISREPSLASMSRSHRSRRLSVASDDNVFSDDYALDSPVTIDNAPLGHVPPPRQQYSDDPFLDRDASERHLQQTVLPLPLNRGSTAKRRLMIDDDDDDDDVPTTSNGGLGRTLSASSRITIPRSQSPYNGPMAPSHPYNMYPQMTRADSVASRSTFRPASETPFVPRGGPENSYEMYSQNTVPTEDEDITTNGIPLGFPRNSNFQPPSGASNSDVGDIIGSDGHIEQLPPYTRYADNTVAKGNMDGFNRSTLSRMSSRISQATAGRSEATAGRSDATAGRSETNSQPTAASTVASTTLLQPTEQFVEETEAQRARKEGWRETWRDKLKRNTMIGIPLWGVLSIVLIVVFSGTVGAVVGGVIGNKKGALRAYANGAVTTIWLDAVSTTLGPNTSPLPTGHFQIPFNQSHEIKDCIPNKDSFLDPAWGCMDIAYMGVNVFQDQATTSMMAAFEDFSVNTQNFKYGPQPPDFNGSSFALTPMSDEDAGEWGVAMFFSVLFDKLSILPEDVFDQDERKRSVPGDVVARSVAAYDGLPLYPSDKPWFCFWNGTINEFFVYLDQDAPSEPSTTEHMYERYSTATITATTAFVSSATSTTSGVQAQELTMTTAPTQEATTFQAYNPIFPGVAAPTATNNKRSYESSAADVSNYPKLIKMVEKRQPSSPQVSGYVQPYCQKMQVLNNWSIMPIMSVPPIRIDEVQYKMNPTATSNKMLKRNARDVVNDMESYCICEWTSY